MNAFSIQNTVKQALWNNPGFMSTAATSNDAEDALEALRNIAQSGRIDAKEAAYLASLVQEFFDDYAKEHLYFPTPDINALEDFLSSWFTDGFTTIANRNFIKIARLAVETGIWRKDEPLEE